VWVNVAAFIKFPAILIAEAAAVSVEVIGISILPFTSSAAPGVNVSPLQT
jgi:hypothetical protein